VRCGAERQLLQLGERLHERDLRERQVRYAQRRRVRSKLRVRFAELRFRNLRGTERGHLQRQ
jgi:hypothetical protein